MKTIIRNHSSVSSVAVYRTLNVVEEAIMQAEKWMKQRRTNLDDLEVTVDVNPNGQVSVTCPGVVSFINDEFLYAFQLGIDHQDLVISEVRTIIIEPEALASDDSN